MELDYWAYNQNNLQTSYHAYPRCPFTCSSDLGWLEWAGTIEDTITSQTPVDATYLGSDQKSDGSISFEWKEGSVLDPNSYDG